LLSLSLTHTHTLPLIILKPPKSPPNPTEFAQKFHPRNGGSGRMDLEQPGVGASLTRHTREHGSTAEGYTEMPGA
jgi:hypothetical protein